MSSNNNIHISVVSPVYKAAPIIDELVKRLVDELSKITNDYEIILVEDGGHDNSWNKIVENHEKNGHVVGIKLSRNFGQDHAIAAGLNHCRGEWIIVMDCDLQDRPEEIINLYNKAREGYEIVHARRSQRQDNVVKKIVAAFYRRIIEWLSGVKYDRRISNFGIYHRKVVSSINKLGKPMMNFTPAVLWVGFKNTSIDVIHANRFNGASSYSFNKSVNLALNTVLMYSEKPLKFIVKTGIAIFIFALIIFLCSIYKYINNKISEPKITFLIISVWLLGGLIIFLFGIIGLYIGKVFEAVKDKPLYIAETIL